MQVVETTTTRRTTVWRRRRPPGLLRALPVLGLLVLLLVGMTTTRVGIEAELAERAAVALSGVSETEAVTVVVEGRDAIVTGTVDGTATVDTLVTSLQRVEGIRAVDVTGVTVEDVAAG